MTKRTFFSKAGAALMAGAMMATSMSTAFAASSTDANNNTATTNDLKNADIIDTSKTGSLSIYKYDITSAEKDQAYTAGTVAATGEADQALQDTLADYAIEGVEFTILRVGNVETYSIDKNGENFVEVVYEIPEELATILGLEKADAIDMTAEGVANKCTNTELHYESTKINQALKDVLAANNIQKKNELERFVEKNDAKIRMDLTDKSGFTTKAGLDLGLYLCVETKVPEEVVDTVNPWFASLPFTNSDGTQWLYDMTCYPKNQTGNPTLDKLVKNGTGNMATEAKAGAAYGIEGQELLVSNLIDDGKETKDSFVTSRTEYTYDDTVTASEGDVLDYILVSKLPHITSEATYLTKYTFTDTLGEGIEYNKDARLAFYTNETDAMVNDTSKAEMIWGFSGNDKYNHNYAELTVSTTGAKTGETQMTVSFTDAGLAVLNGANDAWSDPNKEGSYSDYYIVVYYTGTVNSDGTVVLGDEGNKNDVTLEWRRTSQSYFNTLEDRCYVYSFGIDLTKNFADGAGDPTKVTFNLYNETDGYYVKADKTEVVDGKKVYYVTGKTTNQGDATVFSPDKQGAMIVNGIEGDKYQLTELTTDKGYSVLKDQIVIDIKTTIREVNPSEAGYVGNDSIDGSHKHTDACKDASGALICGIASDDDADGRTIGKKAMYVGTLADGGWVPATATVDKVNATLKNHAKAAAYASSVVNGTFDSKDAFVVLKVTNNKSFLLPQTGGNGLYAVTIAGVVACAAGCYMIVKKKKEA